MTLRNLGKLYSLPWLVVISVLVPKLQTFREEMDVGQTGLVSSALRKVCTSMGVILGRGCSVAGPDRTVAVEIGFG